MRRFSKTAIYLVWFAAIFGMTTAVAISLLIRSGSDVQVPDLVGRTLQEARYLLNQKNLKLIQKDSQYSDRIAAGSIIRQSVPANEYVRGGRTIYVQTSKGSRERSAPHIAGLNRKAAATVLQSSSFIPNVVGTVCSERYPKDTIAAQYPQAGLNVSGREMDVLISKGPCKNAFLMPDLVGMALDEALHALDREGFVIRSYEFVDVGGGDVNAIWAQNPEPGTIVDRSQHIRLSVSQPKEVHIPHSLAGDDQLIKSLIEDELSEGDRHPVLAQRGNGFFQNARLHRVQINGPTSIFRKEASLRIDRGEPMITYRINFTLAPEETKEFAFWLPNGSQVMLTMDGEEVWKRVYHW